MKTKNVLRLMFLIGGAAALYYVYKSQGFSDLRKRLKEELGDQEQGIKSGFVGMANPVKKLTAEEFSIASGVVLAANALAASHPRYYSINTEPVLFGVELEDSDFLKYDFRFCKKDYEGDISGMYYTWENEEKVRIGDCDGTIAQAQNGSSRVERCLWYDAAKGWQYSLTVIAEDVDGLDLTAVAEQICAP